MLLTRDVWRLARATAVAVAVASGALGMGVAVRTATAEAVRISRDVCARLAAHVPDPGVEHRPGVDVRGRGVAPADLPGSRHGYEPPENFVFDVAINPLRGDAEGRFGETALGLGTVAYDRASQRFTLDGRPIGGPEAAVLAGECRRVLTGRE